MDLHIHVHADEELAALLRAFTTQGDQIMATLDEVKQAIADEREQARVRAESTAAEIQALKDQVAAGTGVTPEQLDELVAQVRGIVPDDAAPPVTP